MTLAGNIGDGSVGNVTMTGGGVLALGGLNASSSNGYVGNTILSQGLIQFSALTNLGLGNIIMNGGGLQWAPGTATDASQFNIFLTGNGIFDTNGNNVTLANPVGRGGSGSLTKVGNGVLTLAAGSNSGNITGSVILDAGTTTLGFAGNTTNNGTLTTTAVIPGTTENGVTLNYIAGSGNTTTVSSVVGTGNSSVVTVTLAAGGDSTTDIENAILANSTASQLVSVGGTGNVTGGTVTLGNGTGILSGIGITNDLQLGTVPTTFNPISVILNGGALVVNGNVTIAGTRGIALGNGSAGVSGGAFYIPVGDVLTVNPIISNYGNSSGQLVIEGGGSFVVGTNAANAYTGGTLLINSIINLTNLASSDVGTSAALSTGTIEVKGTSTINAGNGIHGLNSQNLQIDPGATVTLISGGKQFSGINVTGSGNYVFDGSNVVEYTGTAGSFTGNVFLNGVFEWEPQTGQGGSFTNATVYLDAGVQFAPRDNGNGTVWNMGALNAAPGANLTSVLVASTNSGNVTYNIGLPNTTSTFSGNIENSFGANISSNTGNVTSINIVAGRFIFDGTDSAFLGTTTINPGAVLQIGDNSVAALGMGNHTAGNMHDNGLLVLAMNTTGNITETAILSMNGGASNGAGVTATSAGLASDIEGNGSVQDLIAGNLVMNQNNDSYTGSTEIDGGTMSVAFLANGGQNSGIGAGSANASSLVLNGGTLAYTGSSTTSPAGVTTDRLFTIGNATSDLGGDIVADGTGANGALNFSSTGNIVATATTTSPTLSFDGNFDGINNFAPTITDVNTTVPTNVSIVGSTSWNFNGTNTYTGATNILNGNLAVTGPFMTSSVVNVNGGNLVSNSTIQGTVNLMNGNLMPGFNVVTDSTGGQAPIGGPLNTGGVLTPNNLNVNAMNVTGGIIDITFNGAGGNTQIRTVDMFNSINVGAANGLTLGNGTTFNFYTFNPNATVSVNLGTPWSTTGFYNLFEYTGTAGGVYGLNPNLLNSSNVLNAVTGVDYIFGENPVTVGNITDNYFYVDITTPPDNFDWTASASGNWSNAANWNYGIPGISANISGNIINGVGAVAEFGPFNILAQGANATNVTLDVNPHISGLLFTSGTPYDIVGTTGNILTFSNGGTNASTITDAKGNNTVQANSVMDAGGILVDVAPNLTLSLAGNIGQSSGTAAVTQQDSGTLVLSGLNTFAGGFTVNNGNLDLNAGGNSTASPLGTGLFTINGSINLDNTSGSPVTIATNNPVKINDSFSFTGSSDLNLGTGAVTLNTTTPVITLVGASNLTFGGPIGSSSAANLTVTGTTTTSGNLVLNGASTFAGNLILTSGNLNLGGSLAANLVVSGNTDVITLPAGTQTTGAATFTANTATIAGSGNFSPASVTISPSNATNGTSNTTISANIVGSGYVNMNSANSTLTLNGTNTFNGTGLAASNTTNVAGDALSFTAASPGSAGNVITIQYTVGNSSVTNTTVTSVSGNTIIVTMKNGGDTGADVAAAIQGNSAASALVNVVNVGSGVLALSNGSLTGAGNSTLSGGALGVAATNTTLFDSNAGSVVYTGTSNGTADNGVSIVYVTGTGANTTVSSVVGNVITVTLANGGDTVANVTAAIAANATAASLVNLGTSGNSGVIAVNGTSTLAGGGTNVNLVSGTLNVGSAGALGSGPITIIGGHLVNTSGSAITSLTSNNAINLNGTLTFGGSTNLDTGTGAVTLLNNSVINQAGTSVSVLELDGNILGNGFTLTTNGTGRLNLGGTSYVFNNTTLNGPVLTLGGVVSFTNNAIISANNSGTGAAVRVNGTVSMGGSSALSTNAEVDVGNGTVGVLTFNSTGNINANDLYVGVGNTANSSVSATGTVNQTSGTIDLSGTNGTYALILGNGTGGTGSTSSSYVLGNGTAGSATLIATNIGQGGSGTGTSTLTLNGGVIVPTGNSTNFIAGLTKAQIGLGGFTLNTAGDTVTLMQNLTSDTGNTGGATDGGFTINGGGVLDLGFNATTGVAVTESYTGNTNISNATVFLGNVTDTSVSITGGNVVVGANGTLDTASKSLTVPVFVNNGGVLKVEANSITTDASITIANGGKLISNGGGATLNSAVTISSGATFQPGVPTGNGITTINGSLSLAAGALVPIYFDTSAPANPDKIVLTGTGFTNFSGNLVDFDLYQSNGDQFLSTNGTANYTLITSVGGVGNVSNFVWANAPTFGNFSDSFSIVNGDNVQISITSSLAPNQWILATGGSWGNATAWSFVTPSSNETVLPPNGAGANFTVTLADGFISSPSTITLDGNRTVGGINFLSTVPFTIAAGNATTNTLTFDDGSGIAATLLVPQGNDTISALVALTSNSVLSANINTGSTLTLSGGVLKAASGTDKGITVIGTGTLILSGNDTYVGNTTINAGTLVLSGNDTATTGDAILNAGNLDINNATALGTGPVIINGGAIDNTSGANLTLTGTNTFTINNSFEFIGSGNLVLGTGNDTITQSVSLDVNADSLTLTGNLLDSTSGSSLFNKTGNGTLILKAASSNISTIEISAGTVILSGGANRLTTSTSSSLELGNGATGSGLLILGDNNGVANQTLTSLVVEGNGTANAIEGGAATASLLTINLASNTTTDTYSGLLGLGNGNFTVTAANELALTKIGNGTLVLTGNNSYLGNTTVSKGILVISSDSNLGAPTSVLVMGNNTAPTSNTPTLELASNNSMTSNRQFAFNSTVANLTVEANSTLTLGANASITSNNTGDGVNFNGNGTIILDRATPYTYNATATNILGGTVQQDTANILPANTAVTVAAGATYAMNGLNASFGSLAGAGTVAMSSLTGNGNLTVGNNNTSTTFTGIISGNVSGPNGTLPTTDANFVKVGTGNLTLGGNDTFTGQTNITAGTLTVNSSLALQFSDVNYNTGGGNLVFGSGVTAVTMAELQGNESIALTNANGTAQGVVLTEGGDNGTNDYTGDLTGLGSLVKAGNGSLTLSGNAAYNGSTTVSNGSLTLDGTDNTYAGGTTIASNATFTLDGEFSTAPSLAGNVSNNGTFNYDEAGTTTTYAGVISGTGITNVVGEEGVTVAETTTGKATNITNVSVTGDILVLTGNNTNTGSLVVSSSGLIVNGTVQSAITVGFGSYLGGNGNIDANVNDEGGALAPGLTSNLSYSNSGKYAIVTAATLDTLVITGNLIWSPSPGVANVFHLSNSGNTSDRINVLGTVTTENDDTIEFDFMDTGTLGDTYTLLTSSGNMENLGLSLSQLQAVNVWEGGRGDEGSYFIFANGGTALDFVVVPEPSTWGLLAGGAMLLVGWRRKRALAKAAPAERNTQA